MARNISFTLKYWKQNGPKDEGHFDTREMKNIPDDTSFLEMLDILNEELISEGNEPFVLTLHQWSSTRTGYGCNHLSALYAPFQ